MSTWILLERTEDLMPALFRDIDRPHYARLFDSTPLESYVECSPLLVTDDRRGKLLEVIQHSPANWPGLVIESAHSTETVLDHLRLILFIRFEQNRKGILRYWNPNVASQFFPLCSDDEISTWLGPLERLSWYAPHAQDKAHWQTSNNPRANAWLPAASRHLPTLSEAQEQALYRDQPLSLPNGQKS